jgi:hypothetical protein
MEIVPEFDSYAGKAVLDLAAESDAPRRDNVTLSARGRRLVHSR